MSDTLYLGYPRLQDWADAVVSHRPVYCLAHMHPGQSGEHGMQSNRLQVVCAQADGAGTVHYCHLLAGRVGYFNGTPFDNAEARQKNADALKMGAMVHDWLMERGLNVRRAVYAMPKDLVTFEGTADFLGWDKERGWYRADVEDNDGPTA